VGAALRPPTHATDQDSGVLAYADPTLDITPDVVAAVNQPQIQEISTFQHTLRTSMRRLP